MKMQPSIDTLSDPVREILNLDPGAYTKLVVTGEGNPLAKSLLQRLAPHDLFGPSVLKSDADRNVILSALWLWHDWLDESHAISQSLHSDTGSFWHAIMHRREGDFSNSKYWYARAGSHPALSVMANQAGSIVNQLPADKSLLRLIASGWNPNAFVDLVEAIHDDPHDPRHRVAVQLQQLEWQALFEYCARA